ncbi:MAG: autotransporter-associated beta strand repeat-containing protein, partial [Verrucomicrobia bacterium]|nr:autotransporter-associated beta strand repeat-containing protein [Verrucomicrobiota bacterium]
MKFFLFLPAVLAAFLIPANVPASLILWQGNASASWTNGANWVGGSAPADDTTSDQAGFAFSILPAHEPNAGNHEINGLAIGDGTTSMPSFEISGSRITLGDSGIVQNPGASNTTISTLLDLAAAQTWTNNSAGTLLLGGRIDNNGFDLTIEGNGTTRSTERIEGSGAIIKNGTGTLVLEGTNTFTGGTVLSGGTLRAGEGDRRQTLGADTSSVSFNGTGATLQLAGSIADDPRDWIFDETGTIDTNGFDLGINGSTSGAAGLVKTGGGTLTINTTASQEGGTVVRAGGLVFGSAASIAHPEGDLVVGYQDGDSASLLISGADVETNWSILGNAPGSTGNASMTSGSWLVKGNFFVGYQGDGTLSLAGGNVTVDFYQFHVGSEGNGTFLMTGGNITNTNAVLGDALGSSGNATITGGRWTNTMNLAVGDGGTANLAISGNGVVAVGGTLSRVVDGAITLGPGGTLEIGLGGTTGTLDTDLTNNGHLVFNRSTNSTHSKTLSGSGNLSQNGSATLTLSADNTYTGNTAINSGILEIASTGRLGGGSYSGTISNNGSLIHSATVNQSLSGSLSGSGSLTKSGLGALTLSGNNSHSGGTTLADGQLNIDNNNALGSGAFTIAGGLIDSTTAG